MSLKLAPGLALPDDTVTQALGILAKRGAGKSNAGAVLAEEMHRAGLQFVAVDPVGAWWGLRSSADGKGPGLPIPVLGGYHGDIPLEPGAGHLIADLLVGERLSCVLDVSAFSETEKKRFLADFAERLFREKGKPGHEEPLHLFLEEADDYAPQGGTRGGDRGRCLGAFQRIVKQGRARGLGSTMISQRSAALNKDLLTQIDTLIVLRTTSPQDRKAIEGWVTYHDADRELLESLSGLENGEAWVWSPEALDLTKRVKIRRRSTFDSGATPKAGRQRRAPRTVADIDLSALEAQMKETIRKAKESDPRELAKRVRELERELLAADARFMTLQTEMREPKKTVTQIVEVPRLSSEDIDRIEKIWMGVAGQVDAKLESVHDAVMKLANPLARIVGDEEELERVQSERVENVGARRHGAVREVRTGQPIFPDETPSAPAHRSGVQQARIEATDIQIKAGARRMLQVLASHDPMKLTKAQLATLSGMKVTGGTFQTYYGILKREGLMEVNGVEHGIAPAGFEFVGAVPARPGTEDIVEMYRSRLKAGARRMLDVLVAVYPGSISRDALAERIEMESSGGTFQTYLGTLRRNGLAETNGGDVRAGEALYLG